MATLKSRALKSCSLFLILSGCGANNEMVNTKIPKILENKKIVRNESEDTLGLASSSVSYEDSEPWFLSDSNGNPTSYKPENFDLTAKSFRFIWFDSSSQGCSGAIVYDLNTATNKYDTYLVTAHHCLYQADPLGRKTLGSLNGPIKFKTMRFAPVVSNPNIVRKDQITGKMAQLRTYDELWDIKTPSFTTAFTDFERVPEKLGAYDVIRFKMEENLSLADAQSRALPFCSSSIADPDKVDPKANVRLMFGYSANYGSLLTQRIPLPLQGSSNLIGRFGIGSEVFKFLGGISGASGSRAFAYTNLAPIRGENEWMGTSVSYAQDSGAPIFFASHSFADNDSQFANYWKKFGAQAVDKYRVNRIECFSGTVTREYASNQRIHKSTNPAFYKRYGDILQYDSSIIFVESRANAVWTQMK